MADSSSPTLDEEGGNRNDDAAGGGAANALSSPPSSSQSPMPVAPPPVNTRDCNNNNNSNNNNEERVGNGDNTIDSSAAAKGFTINMENLRYAMESFVAIVKPVFLTMILTALAVVFISTPESVQASEEALSNTYKVMKPTDDDDGDGETSSSSTGQQLGASLVNGLVIVSVICAMTFVIVLLYKYRCMKCLLGYMILSTTLLLCILTAAMFQVAIDRYRILIDAFSFWFLIYNFALVGTGAIFWARGLPQWTTQGYLVSISVIVAWQLSHFDAWTAWVLLVLLALYDLFAVLTPCGPLKALVKLMQRDDAPVLPGLLYEANVPNNNSNNPTTNQQSNRSRQQQQQQSQDANSSNAENGHATTTNSRAGEESAATSNHVDYGSNNNNRHSINQNNVTPTPYHAPPTRRDTTLTEAMSERSSPDRSTAMTEATVYSDEQRSSSLSLFVGTTGDGSVEIETFTPTTTIATMMQRDESEITQATETNSTRTTVAAATVVNEAAAEAPQHQRPSNENSSTSSSRNGIVVISSSLPAVTQDKETGRGQKESSSTTTSTTTAIHKQDNSHETTTTTTTNNIDSSGPATVATPSEEQDEEVAKLTSSGRGDDGVAVQDAAQVEIVDQETSTEPLPSSQPELTVHTNNDNNNTGRIPLSIAKFYKVPLRDNPTPWMTSDRRYQRQSASTGGDDDTQQQEEGPPAPEFSVEELKELVDVVFPRNGGRIVPHALQRQDAEIRYCVLSRTGEIRRILFVNEETGAVYEDPNHERTTREERKQRNSIRLGLGDFIFYSILVAKAALYSWTTFSACTLSIITGLGLTLLMLAVYGHALPALPISIFLGVVFYLITRYAVEPFVEQVFIEQTYV